MTIDRNGLIKQPGQGLSYWVLGDLYTFKTVADETEQAYSLCEIIMQPNSGTPPHSHSQEDEAFYVQSGEIEFQLGERTIVATAGTFLHSPKGQVHRFTNIGNQPAQLLCWQTPAGLEKFLMEIGTPTSDRDAESPGITPADIEKVMMTAPKYGLEIIAP
jgi:mannose-6-phosphate isomerase-like protein (cupin superfamily)